MELRSWLAKWWELRSLCAWPEPCDSLESRAGLLQFRNFVRPHGTSVVVGGNSSAVGVAVAVRLTRGATRNLRFYACCSLRNFVSLGGQWNFGRGWRSGRSCGRCTLGQSRATRANIALRLLSSSAVNPQFPAVGCGGALDKSRATRANLRFYACCCLRSFVSLGGQWNSGGGCISGESCGRCA